MKSGLAAIFGGVLAMRPTAFDALCGALAVFDGKFSTEEGRGLRWMAGATNRARKGASVAVMGLYGMIDKRSSFMMDLFGGTSTDTFGAVFDQLVADDQIKGIVMDVDSPGGTASGIMELSDKIYAARDKKPIVSVSNNEMNSAGYWIGSSASKVFVSPSSNTGSIGVWSAAASYVKQLEADGVDVKVWRSSGSPNKAPFLPFSEFTDEAIANEQSNVDRIYGEFRSAVARNRGVTENRVQKDFGQGKVFGAQEAVSLGLADKVATLEDVIRKMESGRLTLGSMGNVEDAWSEPETPDESWRDINATERLRSDLRRKGVLS